MQTVVLNESVTSVMVLVNGGSIEVDITGCAKIRNEDGERFENLINPVTQSEFNCSSTYEPSRSDKISQYCMLLFESNRCGHKVDTEIDEALKAYRTEVGI